ncbi:MAG: MFS transporter [Lachnospiraceae bacterium]|nr:MFS transporter [Lachnospiraceae bacterium]
MRESQQKKNNVFFSRNFRLVFFGALVSDLGTVLYSFAVSFYILEITGNNAFMQGLYLALCSVVLLIATPVGGVLGDRFNKARIMFICDYLKGGIILLATLGMVLFPENSAHVGILFAAGILGNAVSGIFTPAANSLFPHIVEEDRLQQANAYFSVKSALQSIFGVVMAGIMYAVLRIQVLFLIVGICYVLSGVSEMFIRYEHAPSPDRLTVKTALSDMAEGSRYLKSQKAIMVLMAAILFINFFFSPILSNFIPYFIKTDVAGAPSYIFDSFVKPELWSSVFSILVGISSLAGSLVLSARPQQEKCGRKVAARLTVLAAAVTAVFISYWLLVDRGVSLNAFLMIFCISALLCGFLVSLINIPISTAIMKTVERDKLSKVTSIVNVISQGLIPISAVLAGIILQTSGSTLLLLICSLGFAATALFLLFNKEIKNI